MKAFKYFSTALIMIFLTVGIVLLPETVMIGKTATKNNSPISWEYTNSETDKLTPQQFVILYTTGDVALNPLLHESYFTTDEKEITVDVKSKLNELFRSDSDLCEYFCDNIGKITYHEKRSALTLFMDEMIALKFTEVRFGNNATLIYEEKTGVVTEFSCIADHEFAEKIAASIDGYYADIANYYSYHYNEEKITEEGFFFSFGLISPSRYDKKAEAEYEYTN